MAFSLPGVHLVHHKKTAGVDPVRMPAPSTVTLYTAMHIGAPATPVVKVGDHVDVGTVVAAESGTVSARIHASVSGKVAKLIDVMGANGKQTPAIVIESDGAMTLDPSLEPPLLDSREAVIEAIKCAGLVGLGGAGFPTHVKFNVSPEAVDTLVINGAECEPFITSDDWCMRARSAEILHAIKVLDKYWSFDRIIIGIEKNKPEAIATMQALTTDFPKLEVKVLPSIYPRGAEKVIVYECTGRVIPMGALPLAAGCIVANVTTLATMGAYFQTGLPLVEKCVTVEGTPVNHPQNVIVPVGTSIEDLVAFCGGWACEAHKVVYGGPMMGTPVTSTAAPVLKNTNAVLCFDEKEAVIPDPTPCIRCGACTNHCPMGINPAEIARAYKRGDMEALDSLAVNLCMECGCCSYICPAHRPLVQTNKLSKIALKDHQAKEAKEP